MTPHYRNDSTLGYKDTVDSTAAAQTHAEGHDNSSSDHSRLSQAAVTATTSTEPASEQHGHDAIRTASTASTTATSAPRKSRVNLACKRCKRRKQRVSDAPDAGKAIAEILMLYVQCDGTQPNCRSCEKVGIACAYEKAVRPQYPGGKSLYVYYNPELSAVYIC